jgi:hypothetical protein
MLNLDLGDSDLSLKNWVVIHNQTRIVLGGGFHHGVTTSVGVGSPYAKRNANTKIIAK